MQNTELNSVMVKSESKGERMKKLLAVILTGCMMLALVGCGEKAQTDTTSQSIEQPAESSENENGTQQNDETIVEDSNESNKQTDTSTDEGLAVYTGAYTDGTNYLVIEGESITLNGQKCEVSRIQTDHFKSGIPVYYFMYENNEISIYYDEVCGMGCSLDQPDGSWLTYETIDVAQVPHFDVKDADTKDSNVTTATNAPNSSDTNSTPKPDATNAYTFTCGGQAVSLPCSSEDLAAAGWTYDGYYFTNGVSKFEPKYNSGGWTEGNMINGAQGQVDWSDLAMADGITFGTTVAEFEGTIGKCDYVVDQGEQIIYYYKTCTLWVTPSSMTVKGISFSAE